MARFPNTPRFIYGDDDRELILSLPTTPFLKASTAVGGDIEADSGVRTAFIVRRDEELTLTLRIWEDEWPDVQDFLDVAIAGGVFTWFPNAEDEEESYDVTLITPAVNSTYAPTPDENYPRVLNFTITFTSASFDGAPASVREFQDEFETRRFGVDGASTERRPDAVSLDYLRSATLGPVATGDPSEGITFKWRVREVDGDIFICRESDDGTAWGPETLLFSYDDFDTDPILELDFAFTQNARAVVVAERASGMWLYWFDPLESDFVFVNIGSGRCPRCLLDDLDPLSQEADVLIFYMNDEASGGDGAMCYRQQRDRYEIEYLTPIVSGDMIDIPDPEGGGIAFRGRGLSGGVTASTPADLNVTQPFQPPFHHGGTIPPAPQFGDWQIADQGLGSYAAYFEFDRPMRQIDLQINYANYAPLKDGMFMHAIVDRSFIGAGGTFISAATKQFFSPSSEFSYVESLVYEPGFTILLVTTPLRLEVDKANAPTFGPGTMYPVSVPTEFEVPESADIFLEDAVKSVDGRVVVLYALRDRPTGTYSLQKLISSLYPVRGEAEPMELSQISIADGNELRTVLIIVAPQGVEPNQIDYAFTDPDEGVETGNMSLLSGELFVNLIAAIIPGDTPPTGIDPSKVFYTTIEDALETGNMSLQSGTLLANLFVVILPGTSPPAGVDPSKVFYDTLEDFMETGNMSLQATGTSLNVVVIVYDSLEIEAMETGNMSLQSGTLVIP